MKHVSGFTIIELMITVAVIAVMLTIAVPSFGNLVQNNRMTTNVNDIIATFTLARSEAIKRSQRVTLCPVADADACGAALTPAACACSGANTWETGFIAFADTDGDAVVDAGETIIKVLGSPGNNVTIRSVTAEYNTSLTYLANSIVNGSAGTLKVCDSRGATQARGVRINTTGRVRVTTDANDDGTHEDHTGTALTCP